ncbi:MAG: CPBP family intramembrane metalloprotease, partial [Ignavibacteriae bacterium]|nr:CPBP family intramembrane metalloprotease [Ignavibacteriota bacterium]
MIDQRQDMLPSEQASETGIGAAPTLLQRVSPAAFAIISLCLVFFLYQVVGGIATLLLFRGEVNADNVQSIRVATLVGQLVFILLPTLILVRRRYPESRGFFRLKVPHTRELLLTTVAVFALQQLLQGYMMVQGLIPFPSEVQHFIDEFKKLFEETYKVLVSAYSPMEFAFVILVIAITPAISEELLFRGLVQRSLERSTSGFRAAIIAGVIFGVYHMNPFSVVPLAALGVYFGFIVYRSQNTVLAIAAHFFNNFIASTAVYLQ